MLGTWATFSVVRPAEAALATGCALADAVALAAGLAGEAADGPEVAGGLAEAALGDETGAAVPPQAASNEHPRSPKKARKTGLIGRSMLTSILGPMGAVEEQRRAPRTVVDVEALLHLNGLRSFPGVIHDLAYLGCLFVPEKPLTVCAGDRGSLRFALPVADPWLEPNVEVRRLTTFNRLGGDVGQGIGMEFSGLKAADEHAITTGCQEWDGYRTRQYELAARCYVESEGGSTHYARFGKLLGGTRNYLRLNLPSAAGLTRGIRLRLKMARTWVAGEVEQTAVNGAGLEVLVRIEGWGRDFFLHEARRQSLT